MIGGIDVRLPSAAGPESLEVAVRAIRQLWPFAVFEHGETGERYDYFWQIPFGTVDELFVYRNANAADMWDERGAIPETCNSMIHLLYDDGLVSIVIDERDPGMENAIDAIRSGLDDSMFSLSARLEAV